MPQPRKIKLPPLPSKITGTLGSRLKKYRKLRAKTQKEIAKVARVTEVTVRNRYKELVKHIHPTKLF